MVARSMWLWLGGAWSVLCTGLAGQIVLSYLRHRDTGDQAGVALGMLFLVMGNLPVATSLLLLGLQRDRGEEPSPLHARAGSLLVISNAIAFLAFGVAYVLSFVVERSERGYGAGPMEVSGVLWYGGLLAYVVGSAALWLAIASLAFPRLRPIARAVLPLLLWAMTAFTLVLCGSLLAQVLQPGPRTLPMLAMMIQIAPFGLPNLALIVLLVHRARMASSASSVAQAEAASA